MPAAHASQTAAKAPPLTEDAAEALRRMRRINPEADPQSVLPGVDLARIPRHVAIIMDGNGRWAQAQGLPRVLGHKAGVEAVRRTLEACSTIGVEALTLFSFSSENWKRPREEVEALMGLLLHQLRKERDGLVRNNIRLRHIGRREGLPEEALRELDAVVEATSSCSGPTLCLALNYGSRAEIVDAVRSIARRAAEGSLAPDAIDESCIDGALNTAGLPDPDLLIRTAGERRLSNFLLWQVSYAEIHVTEKRWPDFGAEDLYSAIRDYAARERRFGGISGGARERR